MPYLALPTTTVCAQGCRISINDPLSKNPLCHSPFISEEVLIEIELLFIKAGEVIFLS